MRFLLGMLTAVAVSEIVNPTVPPPKCTCGPTCPLPTAKPWPIPASMQPVKR